MDLLLIGCSQSWNDPYSTHDSKDVIFHSSFSERPKHLDPVSSYSENEARFNAQIYEPVLQYHFTKRPYELVPLTGTGLPKPAYYDLRNNKLKNNVDANKVAYTIYEIEIKPNIYFQPHPCFATDSNGRYRYHNLRRQDIDNINQIADFRETGSRELVAEDYVYQIKRLVHPRLHSPIAGLMGKYIFG